MSKLAPILVATDGSQEARAAAGCARILASRLGQPTVLLHVMDPRDNLWDFALDGAERLGRANRELLAAEAGRFSTPVEALALDGVAADLIVQEADRIDAGVIVLGTRGRSGLGRAVFGSVAMGVLRHADRPVLIVHEEVEAFRHIVAGIDESPLAAWVVEEARRVADATGAMLHLVHVLPTDRHLAAHPEAYGIPRQVFEQELAATAERVFGPRREAAGPGAQERLLFGWAPDQLREHAQTLGAELVVVGRAGRSGRALHHPWSVAVALAMKGPFATLIV